MRRHACSVALLQRLKPNKRGPLESPQWPRRLRRRPHRLFWRLCNSIELSERPQRRSNKHGEFRHRQGIHGGLCSMQIYQRTNMSNFVTMLVYAGRQLDERRSCFRVFCWSRRRRHYRFSQRLPHCERWTPIHTVPFSIDVIDICRHDFTYRLLCESKTNFSHLADGMFRFWTDLVETLVDLHKKQRFAKLVFYLEACESGSMFNGLLPDNIDVFATTAASPDESSYACYYDELRQTYLGDVYSVKWMEVCEMESRQW